MARASAMIKFLDENERTLAVDARDMLGIPKLEGKIVVIRGQAKRDSQGNLTIAARTLYVRTEPPTLEATEEATGK